MKRALQESKEGEAYGSRPPRTRIFAGVEVQLTPENFLNGSPRATKDGVVYYYIGPRRRPLCVVKAFHDRRTYEKEKRAYHILGPHSLTLLHTNCPVPQILDASDEDLFLYLTYTGCALSFLMKDDPSRLPSILHDSSKRSLSVIFQLELCRFLMSCNGYELDDSHFGNVTVEHLPHDITLSWMPWMNCNGDFIPQSFKFSITTDVVVNLIDMASFRKASNSYSNNRISSFSRSNKSDLETQSFSRKVPSTSANIPDYDWLKNQGWVICSFPPGWARTYFSFKYLLRGFPEVPSRLPVFGMQPVFTLLKIEKVRKALKFYETCPNTCSTFYDYIQAGEMLGTSFHMTRSLPVYVKPFTLSPGSTSRLRDLSGYTTQGLRKIVKGQVKYASSGRPEQGSASKALIHPDKVALAQRELDRRGQSLILDEWLFPDTTTGEWVYPICYDTEYVVVKESAVKPHRFGVFARCNIPRDTFITLFDGTAVALQCAQNIVLEEYEDAILLPDTETSSDSKTFIHGLSVPTTHRGVGSFTQISPYGKLINAKYVGLRLFSTQDIPSGSEIVVEIKSYFISL